MNLSFRKNGFLRFITEKKIIEIAIAVIFGFAFNALIQNIVFSLITPLLSIILRKATLEDFIFTIAGSVFFIGKFLQGIITFLCVALATYYLIVKPFQFLSKKIHQLDKEICRKCPYCRSEIDRKAQRCPMCTSEVEPAANDEGVFTINSDGSSR
jgi:large conductance mechanosensitive channel